MGEPLRADFGAATDDAVATVPLTGHVVTDMAAVAEIWTRFEPNAARTVFQSHDWCADWLETIGAATGVRPCIGLVERGDKPVMLLPLCLERSGPLTFVRCIGDREADYQAPAVDFDALKGVSEAELIEAMQQVVAALPRHDLLSLVRVPETIEGRPNPMLLLGATPHFEDSYWAELSGDFESFQRERCGAKTLQTLRRKRRKLEAMGQVAFEEPTGDEKTDQVLEALFAQKSAQYRSTGATDILALPGRAAFFRRLASRIDGSSHLAALTCGGDVVAAHWGLVDRGRFYYLMPSHGAGEASRYSPGEILLQHLFQWCFDNDAGVFDFTIGDQPYKKRWSQNRLKMFDVALPRTAAGSIYLAVSRLVRSAKLAARQSPIAWKLVAAARERGLIK